MDGVTLLLRARAAGIEIRGSGEQLHVRGPKRHEALVKQLFEHKAEILRLLKDEGANDPLAPCSGGGNTEPEAAPAWLIERNLSPQKVAEDFGRYTAETPSEARQNLPVGTLLSRFNLWLDAHGERPTTLPILRQALGMATAPAHNPPAYVATCAKCGGQEWGPSGRHTANGAEVWQCIICADPHTPIAETLTFSPEAEHRAKMGEPDPAFEEGAV